MITVLNVLGIPDDNKVKIVQNTGDMKQFAYEIDGNSNIITNKNIENIEQYIVFLGGKHQNIQLDLGDDVIVFNSISNADSSQKALGYLSNLINQSMLPVINYPEKVLETSREKIYQNLNSLDKSIIIPRCERISPNNIKEVKEFIEKNKLVFPLIFRTTIEHGSQNMLRIDNLSQLNSLEQFAFNGENEFYIIEYKDYKSKDGFYRKARFWIIGDKVLPRHLIVANDWNISYDIKNVLMKDNIQFQNEEKDFVSKKLNSKIVKKCMKIKKFLGLDYFGIDCNIDENNNMLIFEITPAMALQPDANYSYINFILDDALDAIKELILDKSKKVTI